MYFLAIFSKMVEEEEEEVTNKFLWSLEIFAIINKVGKDSCPQNIVAPSNDWELHLEIVIIFGKLET